MKWPGVPTGDPDYDVITAESQGRIFKHQQMLVQVQRPGGTHFITSRDRTRTQRPERPPPVAILLFLKASLCAQMFLEERRKEREGERSPENLCFMR